MTPADNGIYLCEVRQAVIAKTKNGLHQLVLDLAASKRQRLGDWEPCGTEMMAYVTLEKDSCGLKSPTKFAAFACSAFGEPYQGDDAVGWLLHETESLVGRTVKATVTTEAGTDGTPYTKVKWLNHPDDHGGIKAMDEAALAEARAKYQRPAAAAKPAPAHAAATPQKASAPDAQDNAQAWKDKARAKYDAANNSVGDDDADDRAFEAWAAKLVAAGHKTWRAIAEHAPKPKPASLLPPVDVESPLAGDMPY